MALNLTGLDDLRDESGEGKPLELPLDLIIEDPNQPRKIFTKASLDEMAASIIARGVRSPISVKPANADGLYIINHGARRYRGSIQAGKETIPAFIDETHNSYDQVIENIHREALKPMEIALFIAERVDEGDKKGEIAKHLGQTNSFVSEHLALVDAPAAVQALAREGGVGAKTLYVLAKASAEFPTEVDRYISSGQDMSRAAVERYLVSLRDARSDDAVAATSGGTAEPSNADDSGASNVGPLSAGKVSSRKNAPKAAKAEGPSSLAKASKALLDMLDRVDLLRSLGGDDAVAAAVAERELDTLTRSINKMWDKVRSAQGRG